VFTLVFLKCAHYSTDFGTRMHHVHTLGTPLSWLTT